VRFFEATSAIDAGPEAVWAVLSDGAGWPSWDSGVETVEGVVAVGETVRIRSSAAPGRVFPVTVTTVEPPLSLRFSGGMPLGLFRGVRSYTLSPEATGGTAFRMREEYTGPLVWLIWRSMPDLGPSFERFAQGLKRRVESGG
jgi:uncharacterized protein YndB with AHSA1/START domain